ncbi:MAG: hypothetical protein US86_C0007G0084 [Candidatus Daviesbacteria bacterium GW2011_GWA2_38_24]|uniref:Response regulatory domain-containing protein n=1 Tax=Candidatus Daviesbacteria bacterium GW2011_GWA2_38_24 TaxID=1618422 RepID=A0A0G0LX95_9BACT|nr:MAG: hypothetical protein US86_C0007G0084 [Candidatus Daviesbacteria bacterium GW2011_GWA2_38_24]KKQ80311.1 MAG: hypothetical protein UT01_C0015G0014 [Candidatus Daviesbacteria bacterium GW2011_GWA1_38_7]
MTENAPEPTPLRILGIGSEPATLQRLHHALGSLGHRFESFLDAKRLFFTLKADEIMGCGFDALITSPDVPGLGLDAMVVGVRELYKITPIILCTEAELGKADKRFFRQKGVDLYLPKPFKLPDLEAVLKDVSGIKARNI